jgi:hypothetical protein
VVRKARVESLEPRFMFSVVSSPVRGDVNSDNIVNSQDLAVVSSNWLSTGSGPLAGDVNGDRIVNSQDLAEISANWLMAGPILSPPVATAGVPFANSSVLNFTDNDPGSTALNYSATVTCGNGHTLTLTSDPSPNGQIVADATGGFDVLMSYTYASPLSNQTFAVTVTDKSGGSTGASTSNFSVGIGPPSVTLPAGPLTLKQTLDLPLSGISVGDGSLLSSASSVQLTFAAAHGTLTFSTTVANGIKASQISGNSTGNPTITAPLAAINATLEAVNGVIYSPVKGYSGSDSLHASISDLGNTGSGVAQTVSQTVAINVTTDAALPTDVPDLQLWLNPSDLSSLDLRTVAYLSDASQQSLNTAAGPSSYNFATNNKFSFAGWVYFNTEIGDTFSITQRIISQAESNGSNGVFALSLSGSGYNSYLDFAVWSGKNKVASANTATGPGGRPFVSGHDYFVAVSFDGSQATDGSKLKIWVDGAQLALANPSGTSLPSTFQHDTASTDQLRLGEAFSSSNMSTRMEDWGVWDNVAFNQADVSSLWAGGAGLSVTAINQLPNNTGLGGNNLQAPTMYWPLSESGGIRNDLSGNGWNLTPSSNNGSDVGTKLQVVSWTDESGVLGAFVGGDGPVATLQMKRMREPTYDPNALGPGRPGVVFGQGQWLYNGVANWMANSPTGAMYQNVLVGSNLSPYEDWFLSSSADTDSTANSERLFMPGYYGPTGDFAGVYAAALRINDTAGNGTGLGNQHPTAAITTTNLATHSAFSSDYYMSPGQLMSFEWSDVGPPGAGGLVAGPWRAYVNGAQQQVYVGDGGAGTASGDWMELASGRSAQMLNGFYDNGGYQSSTQAGSTTVYGDVVAYGTSPTDNDRSQLRTIMMQRAGLTGLLSPLPQTVSTTATTYITSSVVSAIGATANLVLPPVAAGQGQQIMVSYSGTSLAIVNADQGSDIKFNGSLHASSSLGISPGQTYTFISDGSYWVILAPAGTDSVATALATGNSMATATVSPSKTNDATSREALSASLLTPAEASRNGTPFDRLAAFVGKLDSGSNSRAVDAVMANHSADDVAIQSLAFNFDFGVKATDADAWLSTNASWAESIDERVVKSVRPG